MIEAAYRRTDLLEQRRMLMLQWDDHYLQKVRSEDEHRRNVETKRLEQLLGEAKTFRQAADIRAYVSAVVDRRDADSLAFDSGLDQRTNWALRQAGRIDPTGSKPRL